MQTFDPFRLDSQFEPLPVEQQPGAPPFLRLLDDDVTAEDELLERGYPTWLRVMAGAMAVLFLLHLTLAAAATAGAFSPLTSGGDWALFNRYLLTVE